MTQAHAKGRRGPLASAALLVLGLVVTGGAYVAVTQVAEAATGSSANSTQASAATIEEGKKLFAANCATCHGANLQGTADAPSLYGVGAASVDFQLGTGRMPMQAQGPQAPVKPVQFTDEQIAAIVAYVASNGSGPAIPDADSIAGDGDAAHGGELFRNNCAMCHNVAGAGGALTQGKYAPALDAVSPQHIYEAMVTGPQNMPVFSDSNLTPSDKNDIITYLLYVRENPSPGGISLGSIGPVAEGLFIWIFGLGAIVAFTVWIGSRSN